jgi:hypothetical protein
VEEDHRGAVLAGLEVGGKKELAVNLEAVSGGKYDLLRSDEVGCREIRGNGLGCEIGEAAAPSFDYGGAHGQADIGTQDGDGCAVTGDYWLGLDAFAGGEGFECMV